MCSGILIGRAMQSWVHPQVIHSLGMNYIGVRRKVSDGCHVAVNS